VASRVAHKEQSSCECAAGKQKRQDKAVGLKMGSNMDLLGFY
jgi:hypothetical protein